MSAIASFYHRRASLKSASKPPMPSMIAYRAPTGEIQYTPAPLLPNSTPHSTPQQSTLANQRPSYDSDAEPLLPTVVRSHTYTPLSEDARNRFTATGRPMPVPTFATATLQTWGVDMFTAPQFLPIQYTDDSIIPAIVTNVIPSSNPDYVPAGGAKKRRNSLAKVFKKDKEEDKAKGKTKVVFMTRRDYLKWFAKDENGDYIGTEPKRDWTEEELDEKFAHNRPTFSREKKNGRRHSTAARIIGL